MNIYLFALFVIGFPVIGVIIDMIIIRKALVSSWKEIGYSIKPWKQMESAMKSRIIYISSLPFIGLFIGIIILIFSVVLESNLNPEVENKILWASSLAVGLPNLFICIGLAFQYREAIPSILKNEKLFFNHFCLLLPPMTGAVYCFVLSLLQYRILESTNNIIPNREANYLFYSYIFFILLSTLLILKGYLPTCVKGHMVPGTNNANKSKIIRNEIPYYKQNPVFAKKLVIGLLLDIPLIIGFFNIAIKMVYLGLI